MKKFLIIMTVLLLTACGTQEVEEETIKEFTFLDTTFTYVSTTSTGYDQFSNDQFMIEVKCDDSCIISFTLEDDIYIVTGNSEEYNITKNGTTILFDGEDKQATGLENPEFNQDIIPIFKGYNN